MSSIIFDWKKKKEEVNKISLFLTAHIMPGGRRRLPLWIEVAKVFFVAGCLTTIEDIDWKKKEKKNDQASTTRTQQQ